MSDMVGNPVQFSYANARNPNSSHTLAYKPKVTAPGVLTKIRNALHARFVRLVYAVGFSFFKHA